MTGTLAAIVKCRMRAVGVEGSNIKSNQWTLSPLDCYTHYYEFVGSKNVYHRIPTRILYYMIFSLHVISCINKYDNTLRCPVLNKYNKTNERLTEMSIKSRSDTLLKKKKGHPVGHC